MDLAQMNCDPELLDKLTELAGRQARLVLLELKQPLLSTWVLMTQEGKFDIVPTPWRDDLEKRLYAELLRDMMRENKVVAYSFVTEAWVRSLEAEEWDQDNDRPLDGLTAGQHPARQEAVIACACSKDLVRWKRWRIVREATTERIVDLKEQPMLDGSFESWISEMLRQ